MFKLIWVFGVVLGGNPQIQKMAAPMEPTTIEECQSVAAQDAERMADWARGVLRKPLDFPVGVYGECDPVSQDASQ